MQNRSVCNGAVESKIGFGDVYAQRIRVSEVWPLEVVLARGGRQSFYFDDFDLAVAASVQLPEFVGEEDQGDGEWEERAGDG